jgi:hypothetical protein
MIKVTLGEAKTIKPFPKLMWSETLNIVVLFQEPSIGVVVVGTLDYPISWHTNDWLMARFTDYNEPITLQNA